MSSKKIRKGKPTRSTLSDSVETITYNIPDSPLFDVEDNDVLGYVDQFLRSYSRIQPLEKTSLLSREEALKALAVLEKAQSVVQSHLKTAKALKHMLNTRGDEAGESH
ncbi:MAG: hypothetical protein J0M12_01825 [Deltaproteobacteria bacterium]|nr:hypothetical protein [Deltaproteobacteria bacterium]